MLGPADRAVDACEEDRRGIEALAIGDETGGDVSSGLRTSHHDGTHWPLLLLCCCVDGYATPVKIIRRDRDKSVGFIENVVSTHRTIPIEILRPLGTCQRQGRYSLSRRRRGGARSVSSYGLDRQFQLRGRVICRP